MSALEVHWSIMVSSSSSIRNPFLRSEREGGCSEQADYTKHHRIHMCTVHGGKIYKRERQLTRGKVKEEGTLTGQRGRGLTSGGLIDRIEREGLTRGTHQQV